jgi:NADH-quinone oxidoreductase subunit E
MSYFTPGNLEIANEIISRYPVAKSALIPLLHLAQEQEGWVTDDAMRQIAELTDTTPAEVKGTGSFYEMFKFHPVGKYMVNVCTNLSCQLLGGEELLAHAEKTLGVKAGGTTADGMFTIEDVECIAACTEAPCLQVNYRYKLRVTTDDSIAHRRHPQRPGDRHPRARHARPCSSAHSGCRRAGVLPPEQATERPVWLARNDELAPDGTAEGLRKTHAVRSACPWLRRQRRPQDRHVAIRARRQLHLDRYEATDGYRRPAPRTRPHTRRGPRRGPRGNGARPRWRRFPGRRQVGLHATRQISRTTSLSTATSPSRAPTRTACSWSAILTS